MNVKRYIAKTAPEAIEAIKNELGNDAYIISQRTVHKKGLAGLFQKSLIEITAAYEEQAAETPPPRAAIVDAKEELARMAQQLADLKEIMLEAREKEKQAESHTGVIGDPVRERAKKALVDHDVEERVAEEYIGRAWEEAKAAGEEPPKALRRLIEQRIGQIEAVELNKRKHHIIMLAGPTGNGKTTTLVKIAGLCLCRPETKVGLVNTDTYRIGAYDQLRIYSDILEIPLVTAETAEELKAALVVLADRDVILIDTAGKNSWDKNYQENLKELIDAVKPDDILLVISVNTSRRAVQEILTNYSCIGDFKLIISKLDEVKAWGNVLNIMCAAKRPLAYVTTGQSVPDDIERPDVGKIMDRILPEKEKL